MQNPEEKRGKEGKGGEGWERFLFAGSQDDRILHGVWS